MIGMILYGHGLPIWLMTNGMKKRHTKRYGFSSIFNTEPGGSSSDVNVHYKGKFGDR